MAGENENESKFGFKDKQKAEETLKLLQEHELQYQKLTVRGLLGRAKRVLSMTKAEDKIKNINEAIEVFDQWLTENGGGAANKNTKTDNTDKADTVYGLGFKDKDAAKKTLKILDGRDPEYQKLAIKGLIGSSKRVLTGTKNEDKIKSIQEGVQILEDFLEKFDKMNLMKLNKAYLSYELISKLPKPCADTEKLAEEFLDTYGGEKAKGNYKHLRTLYPKADINDDDADDDDDENEPKSWDIVRNDNLKVLCEQMEKNDEKLFNESGEPTEIHLKLIHWAYTPQPDKLKSFIEKSSPKHNTKAAKRKYTTTTARSTTSSSSSDDISTSSDDSDVIPSKLHKCY